MSFFRRAKRAADEIPQLDEEVTMQENNEGTDLAAPKIGPESVAPGTELPGYIDMGAIQIKPVEGIQVNLPQENPPYEYITFLIAGSALQIAIRSCPRSDDGWAERKKQVKEAYIEEGFKVDSTESRYGEDLVVEIPVNTPDGRKGVGQIRFAGVSGDRWVAQLAFHGAAVDPDSDAAKIIDGFVDSLKVVRGQDPMPPYVPLTISLPEA